MVAAILNGAAVVRVHRVRAAVEAALIADRIVEQMKGRETIADSGQPA
jgi:dihydropteroate synthase